MGNEVKAETRRKWRRKPEERERRSVKRRNEGLRF